MTSVPRAEEQIAALALDVVHRATRAGVTIAVAESLTGGALAAALVGVPGASAVFRGGIVAYDTRIKASVVGVDAGLLEREGAVHADVAAQLAIGCRELFAIDGRPADIGIGTTGVAGPEPQDGAPVGRFFVAVAHNDGVEIRRRDAPAGAPEGRADVRAAAVLSALTLVAQLLPSARE